MRRQTRTPMGRLFAVVALVALLGGEMTWPAAAAPQDPFVSKTVMTASNTPDQTDPVMAGSVIAWADRRTGINDIVTYDTDEGTEQRLALAVPLPAPGTERTQPATDGKTLVWVNTPPPDQGAGAAAATTALGQQTIGAYDLARRKVISIRNVTPARKRQPAVSDGVIVYSDKRGDQWDIYGYDIAKDTEFPIAVGGGNHGNAVISGNTVVYEIYRDGSWDLMGYDLRAQREFPLAVGAGDQRDPQISGTRVVYLDWAANGGNPALKLIDFDKKESRTLTRDHFLAKPTISGDYVVWEDLRSGLPNVYLHDLKEGKEYAMTRTGTARTPFVAGNTLGWLNASAFTARVTAVRLVDRLPSDRRDAPTTQEPEVQYFPETGHFLRLGFKDFWQGHGALSFLGYPISEEFREGDATVQYFERGKLEYPDATKVIRLGLVGVELTRGRDFLQVPPFGDSPERRYFPETGHSLATGFKQYWDSNDGKNTFGFPISEELTENGLVVQYFERGRLEYHPELEDGNHITLGRLGEELLEARGWIRPPPPDTTHFPEYS